MIQPRLVWFVIVTLGNGLQGQERPLELAVGVASPSSDLSTYAKPGAFLELHIGPRLPLERWTLRSRLQLASYQPKHVMEAEGPNSLLYERRTSSFTWAAELLTPATAPGDLRLRGLFGLGLEAWRLQESETRRYGDGVTPDQRTDNGYGVYFGWQATLGLRLDFARQAHAEVRVEASKVTFVGVFEDRHFNAPVRLTASVGWGF